MADLSDTITTAASDPASVTSDGQSATTRPIADLILADQYLAAKDAVRKRRRGITFTKVVTPGALDDCGGTRVGIPFNQGGM